MELSLVRALNEAIQKANVRIAQQAKESPQAEFS